MYIEKIRLNNFRNYSKAEVRLSKGINIFRGKNAQGKTNLIEAVYFCCVGRSSRTPRDKELIRWDETNAYVGIKAVGKYKNTSVETYITNSEKRIAINGLGIKRIGELIGEVRIIFFSPDELKVIKEAPSDRRKFLDIDISQLHRTYFYDLSRYNKIISQRNKLLKTGKAVKDTLHIWNLQLAKTGWQIAKRRKEFIDRLRPCIIEAHSFLTDGKELPDITYESECQISEEEYLDCLERTEERDKAYGHTSFGVHRDDFSIKADGIDLRSFGSQGQQRTAALALKLGELSIFEEETGEKPILILDDVLSELDKARQLKLIERIKGLQTLLTCTHVDIPLNDCKEFVVSDGSISVE